MTVPGYRFLFVTYPLDWRVRYADEVLEVPREHDTEDGRRAASIADRVGLLADGLAHRFTHHPQADFSPPVVGEHRFDQTNGLIHEREATAFENEHTRWWDQLDVPGFVPVAMTGGRPQVRT